MSLEVALSKLTLTSKIPLEKYESFYRMDHTNRGRCIIINIENFDKHLGCKPRSGTDKDANDLRYTFTKLGFTVIEYKDLGSSKIIQSLETEAQMDYSDNDCFACCILTHGERGALFGKDGKFPAEKIFEPFKENNCPSLSGKPKLFFIQACQGCKLDGGVKISFTSADCNVPTYDIRRDCDFLIAWSTVPDYFSFRNRTDGSWFIQELCTVFNNYAQSTHLLDMLTIVNCNVAYDYQSNSSNENLNEKKEIPFIVSTLMKNLYFYSM